MHDFSTQTDEALALYIRTQDKEAYRELVARYEQRLLRYAKHLLFDESIARDVVQEAFIKAYINLNGFNVNKRFSTWIYRIVHNEAINVLGKRGREVPMPEHFDQESTEDVIKTVDDAAERERVENCITHLPVAYREPLTLFFFDEKSYEEISDILRIPVGTVGTRIRRAKLIMKKLCQTK